jgi:hypothetical protein
MFLKLKRVVSIAAAAVLISSWFVIGMLENSYVNYPRSPDPLGGRIIAHAVKGIVVYITESQSILLSWLSWVEIGSAAIVALIILVHRGDPFRHPRS